MKYYLKCIFILFCLLHTGSLSNTLSAEESQEQTQISTQPLKVETQYKTQSSQAIYRSPLLTFNSTLEYKNKVKLVSETPGKVQEILFTKGFYVKIGQEIIRLEPKNKSQLITKAESELSQKKLEYETSLTLFNKGMGSKLGLKTAQKELHIAKANLSQAKIEFGNTIIKAPFNGYLDDVLVKVGDYVNGGDTVASFFSAEPLIAKAYLSAEEIKKINVGDKTKAMFNNEVFADGVVSFISKVLDPKSHTFLIEVDLTNFKTQPLVGEDVQILVSCQPQPLHKVSESSLILKKGAVGIKTLNDDGVVKSYNIKILDEEKDGVWISGLPEKVNIIVLGHSLLEDGSRLEQPK